MAELDLAAFDAVVPWTPADEARPAVELREIPAALSERGQRVLKSNAKLRGLCDESINGFASDSERANSIAYHAGVFGLSKEDAAWLLGDLYSRPGKKKLHRGKLALTLRAWQKGQEHAAQEEASCPVAADAWEESTIPSTCAEEEEPAIPRETPTTAATVTPGISPDGPEPAPALGVPDAGMIGVAREFADVYAAHLESPRSFFYFSCLTYIGALIAAQVTLDSALEPEPRLYTVLLGESADTRKTTALRKTDSFFRSLGPAYEVPVLLGAGSAEGLAAELKERREHAVLLHLDEFKAFVDKARAESSVLLPMVSTLFERNDYDNRTKESAISVRGASLSLLAACTADTYATMFDQRFFAIGFLNRLWLVVDRTTQRIPVPRRIPEPDIDRLRARVTTVLDCVRDAYVANGSRPVAYAITSDAMARYTAWYMQRENGIFERRLDTYGHRLMVLLAVTSGKRVVDTEVMEAVLALLQYQLDARRESDPVNAENKIAAMEEKIRRALARGPLNGRDVKKRVHYERDGLWVWNTAIGNLKRAGEVAYDGKRDLFRIVVVPTPVPTTKREPTIDEHGVYET